MSGGDKQVVQTSFVAYAPSNSQRGVVSHQKATGIQEAYAAQPGSRLPLAITTELRPNEHSQSSSANLGRRKRYSYGEDERAFVMVCAILRNMKWRDIEQEFNARFPAGQKRRYLGIGLSPRYLPRPRTARELLCLYYRIRDRWGIPKIRRVSEDEKARIRTFVTGKLRSMYHLPEIQCLA